MKNLLFIAALMLATIVQAGQNQLQIGEKAKFTDVKMKSTSGITSSLNDLKSDNGLVVIFSCNTCPYVLAWEDRYNTVNAWAKSNKVGLAVLNSNHLKRDSDDSLEAMKKHATEKGYQFPYLLDDESLIANAVGAQTTPHVFVFDDNFKDQKAVEKNYLKDAVQSLSAGKSPTLAETKPLGCSIKRKVN
jgi:peroxiredoxin